MCGVGGRENVRLNQIGKKGMEIPRDLILQPYPNYEQYAKPGVSHCPHLAQHVLIHRGTQHFAETNQL